MDWFSFLVCGLAIWRITHLFTEEDGPFDSIIRFRAVFGQSLFGDLLDCFYCLSIWISLPFALLCVDQMSQWFLYWMGLAGLAALLQKITTH